MGKSALELHAFLHGKMDMDGWVFKTKMDKKDGSLDRLFWMSQEQIALYKRYPDVVVHDNTCKTNRLGMSLTCFVIVDSSNRTRLIACALSRHESTEDYAWGLDRLLEATDNTYPSTIMMDEDAAMMAATNLALTGKTNIVLCIWHMIRNVQLHLDRNVKRRKDQKEFMKGFNMAREAVTEDAFREVWMGLCKKFGGSGDGKRRKSEANARPTRNNDINEKGKANTAGGKKAMDSLSQADKAIDRDDHLFAEYEWGKFGSYMKRMRRRREYWAGPWVKTIFTAGMVSTQRVEMTHRLIKMLGVTSQTPLTRLLTFISTKLFRECVFTIVDGLTNHSRHLDSTLEGDYELVLTVSNRFLDRYAFRQMRLEMAKSYGFEHTLISLDVPTSLPRKASLAKNEGM